MNSKPKSHQQVELKIIYPVIFMTEDTVSYFCSIWLTAINHFKSGIFYVTRLDGPFNRLRTFHTDVNWNINKITLLQRSFRHLLNRCNFQRLFNLFVSQIFLFEMRVMILKTRAEHLFEFLLLLNWWILLKMLYWVCKAVLIKSKVSRTLITNNSH